MKVVILNGSPKVSHGASWKISVALSKLIDGFPDTSAQVLNSSGLLIEDLVKHLAQSEALVTVLPLYVDSLPSHLIEILEGIGRTELKNRLTFYAVLNCGYWEAEHNTLALEMLKNFCLQSNLGWGQGLACGGGGMIPSVSRLDRFPFKGFYGELKSLASNVVSLTSVPDRYCQPSLPRFLYKTAANLMFYSLALKNKVKFRDLYRTNIVD
ncbi:MAG: hypothetical protein LBS44_04280 [Deltaproteobacteria bacterium]|jgi:hypothetical protein|nr:hypothetical protein [Deltaproteobacteria bacterium]